MVRFGIYARYSSDLQDGSSIEDQVRIVREHGEKEKWQLQEVYADHAISGQFIVNRPSFQQLMKDIQEGKIDVVAFESLDRISRDQEEIAGIYKRIIFAGAQMFSLTEGYINELHIGLKGTMNAMFIKDLGNKVRRGLRGRIENGKSGGGKSYGYDVVVKYNEVGERVKGDRTINKEEAEIVRHIFDQYAEGKSPKAISSELNEQGILSPSGKQWGQSAINGNRRRGSGILNNEIYVGKLVWNKVRYIKDPDTGRRQARENSRDDWVTKDVPQLRIIDQKLWDSVKARQSVLDERGASFQRKTRPKYLLSHLLKCGECGGGFSMVNKSRIGCSNARNKGTCKNRITMERVQIEKAVLHAMQHHLMDDQLCREFCAEYTRYLNEVRNQKNSTLSRKKSELEKIKRREKKGVEAIFEGYATENLKHELQDLEDRRKVIVAELDGTEEDKVIFHPNMGQRYQGAVKTLVADVTKSGHSSIAAEKLRELLDKITLTPNTERTKLHADLHGDLAGILTIATSHDKREIAKNLSWFASDAVSSTNQKAALDGGFGVSHRKQVELVAGVGFEPTTFRL